MKKKLLALLGAVASLALFAGCGEKECAHTYDNACDVTCNNCGETRVVEDHVYDNACDADCNVCGDERTPAAHVYDNACDASCNVCGDERTPAAHVYDDACDTSCNVCGDERTIEHTYDNACDASCNVCGDERTPADHVYDNACDASCNVCGDERTPADHVYDNACDASCNVCGDERTPADHVYDNACDASCNVCGDERTPADHVYDNACDTSCNVCGDTRETTHDFALQTSYEATKYFWGGKAALVAGTKAFATLGADKSYGYMPTMDVTVAFDEFTGYSMATSANIAYTFEQVSMEGYTIQAPDGRYLYMKGTYNSFNLADELPEEGGEWTIQPNFATGEVTITNILTNKWIQYDSNYGTYGVYNSQKGTLPMIYCSTGVAYESDENGHWTLCSVCGAAGESIPHSGGTATCTSPALCEYCNREYGEIGDHTFEYGYINCDATQHWIECDNCNAKKEGTIADHTYDYACSSECSLDGCWGTREPAAHVYDQTKFDETNHWNECVCGEIDQDSVVAHNDAWVCTHDNHVKGCHDCDYEDESTRGAHVADDELLNSGDGKHMTLCATCGWGISEEAHTYEKVSANGVDTMTCACGDTYTFNTAVTAARVEFAVTATNAAIATTGASEYESIVSIKLGNYDLGTNLDALVIGSDLAADKASHGEQNIIVTVQDAKGNEHDLEVPVLLVTAYIANTDDFYDAFLMPTAQTAYYGYYAMTANIGTDNMGGGQPWWFAAAYAAEDQKNAAGEVLRTAKQLGRRGCAAQEGEGYGFRGTFDGRGFTITGASQNGGLFMNLGEGALVKDVTIIDVYTNGGQKKSVLANGIYGATIEDVTIKYQRAGWATDSGSLPTNPEANQYAVGWIAYAGSFNATYKNVTIDASGYNFYALFGAVWYAGYEHTGTGAGSTPVEKPNTYENVTVKADSLRYLGYYYTGSTAWNALGDFNGVKADGVKGISITYTAPVANAATNEIKVETTESTTLVLDEAWADWTVVNIAYNGGSLGADLTLASSSFSADDYGTPTFVLTMTKGNVTKYLNVPVTISSGKTITTAALSDRQNVILNNVPSIDLGEYADAGEVDSIIFNDYNLGNDVANLNVTALAAKPEDHGEGNIVVVINKSAAEELQLTIPVKIVTRLIKTMQEVTNYLMSPKEATEYIDGYYMLANDVAYTEVYDANGNVVPAGTEGAVKYTVPQGNWGWAGDKGFRGTLDGNGHTIAMNSSQHNIGLFGLISQGAVIKNVKITDAWNSGSAILCRNAYGATLEDVEISIIGGKDFTAAGTYVKTPIFANSAHNLTMKNVKITSKFAMYALFYDVADGSYTNVTVTAPTVGAYSNNGTTAVTDFPAGITVTQTAAQA